MANPASPATAVDQSKDRPTDPRNREVVFMGADPFDGNLATPINSSKVVLNYINSLPAYRKGLTPMRRGLEVGLAHGYWLIGPFAKFNLLRDTEVGMLAALFATIGLLIISTLAISLYASSNPSGPTTTITTPNPPAALSTDEGWNEYASGFLIGGVGGATVAYFILANVDVFKNFLNFVGA
jgi:photosystem I subunit 11